ncbi:galactose-3-O-sulfotransferase 2-like [Sceloporus undulatus]|uniref:galactose-3-O-sulfotransferase 2-like n=1 Tax=Sceloporus undulatus TaxID=8520 RepID=UPI001C4B6C20|nr:galactose-3-O-sulfotransferase 2-like [Sceloporus undulatus]
MKSLLSNCRCDFRQKQLDLQESRANENSFQVQTNPSSVPLHSEHGQKSTPQIWEEQLWLWHSTAEKDRQATRLSKAFDKTKLLDASLGSEEEFGQKPFLEGTERVQILHETNQWKNQKKLSTRKIPLRDQKVMTLTYNMNNVGTMKTGSSLIQETDSTTRIIANDQNSGVSGPWRSHASKGTTRTKSQALRDKKPTEVALTDAAKNPTQPEKMTFPKGQRTAEAIIPDLSQQAICKPKTHIVFLKVHKSASSTVMNILFRFGETHNLTFALPINGASQLFYPHYFTAAAVEGFVPSKDSQFHIMCHHMRFFQPEVAKVMPNTTFYFAILRNPVHLMESSFTYYGGTSAFAKAKSLEEFLNQTSRFYNASAKDSHYAKNLMAFDFGYNHNGNFSEKQVQFMLRAIEKEFDLLLISEYFDESMVLLKELMCWDLDDVVSFPLNSRHNSSKSHLSKSTREQIKSWNKLDWELYVHFNRTFWEKIDLHIGREYIQQEVRTLQQRRKELAEVCLQEGGGVAPKMIKDWALAPLQYGNAKILGYNLKDGLDKSTRQMCQTLVIPELQYSKHLYRKQFPKKALKLSKPVHLPKLYNHKTV